jgi:hypothetical protein
LALELPLLAAIAEMWSATTVFVMDVSGALCSGFHATFR